MKGWLDNFGKADNANDSNVSLPEGFVGVGYDTKGRNYSPAWGGQFAMGGSIPGSVGFTYARTAGAAPSKGKYAKKTMASAQIGKNVKKDATNIDTGIANKIAGLELQQNPEYQRLKYLQSLPQLRQAPGRGEELVREGLATADIATDLMQIGNFIPHPMAQGVGKAGNILGSGVDLAQALMSARQGDYLDAAINLGSVGLAGGLAANTFRRNSKYLQPGQPLYALSPQAFGSLSRTNYIEPFRKVGKMTDKNLLANRALLGLIGAETVYDAIPQKEYGGDIPSAQNGIMSPMLLARNVLNYFYPSEEAASTVAAAPVEYKKGLTDELLKRQAYKESTFNPAAVSPAGYKGLTQIGEEVISDYSKKKGGKKLDPFNPKDAVELQKFAMDDLYNASFINKPNQPDSVRIAKTLAAYNWGRGNLFNYLNEQKQKGVDIYGSYDWLNDLPKETSDYVNKILLQEDQSFNKNYKRDSTNPKYKDVTSLYDKKKFGGKVTTAQNGQEMKFYQNGLDWKPKSMQDGDNIERVSVNDSRYPELYKNRQVGAYYDGAYSLPDLPEVTVTAPRSYTMDSLRDFTTAALYGAPATAMNLSMVPQAAMTEGIEALRGKPYNFSNAGPNLGYFTSNQRDLSQTMGYENPEGFLQNATNFGLSMIDPLALIGAKGARNLNKAAQSSFGELFRGINPANLKTQSGLDWSKRWYEHPETLQRKIKIASSADFRDFDEKSIERFSNDFIEHAKENLNQYQPKSYIDLLKDKGLKEYLEYSLNTGGLSYGRPDQIYVNRGMYFPFDKKGLESVRTHELSHLVNRNGRALTFPEEDMLLKPFGFEDNVQRVKNIEEVKSKSKKKWISYYTKPTEIKARMDQARFDLNLSPEDKFTPEMFDKISKKNNFYGMGKYIKDKDSFIDLMNNFWAVPAVGVAVGAQAADQQKNGGSVKNNKNPMQRFQGGGQLNFNPLTNEYELPEVVVEGKDERMREAMSQGMAKFYGHVGELMGAPQKEMMQLITGKEQTPSQAFGFQNTGGWLDSYSSFGKNAFNFGLDALGDPVNAIPGVGMIDDISRLSLKGIGQNLGKGIGRRAISQIPSPQMVADNVLASATPNASTAANQVKPRYAELVHPEMDLLQKLKQETIERLDTPEGRRRLQYMINKNFGKSHEAWGKPVEGWGEFFLHGLKSGQLSGYKKLTPDDIIEDFRNLKFVEPDDPFRFDKSNAFAHREGGYGSGSYPVMYMGQDLTPKDIKHVFQHEIGHHLQRNIRPTNLDDRLSKLELKKQPSLFDLNPLDEILEDADPSKISEKPSMGFYPSLNYFNTGSRGMEKLPFAAEVRESLLRRGKIKNYYDEITPQMIEDHYDLYNKTGGNKYKLRLYEIMEKTPKNFKILSETLNNLPAVTLPIAGGAAATISALQNQQPVQKQKNGGITKDNLGYWNPDNWGKPVEIDSNNITMEGVYEPLLGISDTGDTKLMKPGKNYKFKGKKVTEFPVAELGINQLDAQPMKKLNQLLNFTNNPDKDNWLDKYN